MVRTSAHSWEGKTPTGQIWPRFPHTHRRKRHSQAQLWLRFRILLGGCIPDCFSNVSANRKMEEVGLPLREWKSDSASGNGEEVSPNGGTFLKEGKQKDVRYTCLNSLNLCLRCVRFYSEWACALLLLWDSRALCPQRQSPCHFSHCDPQLPGTVSKQTKQIFTDESSETHHRLWQH